MFGVMEKENRGKSPRKIQEMWRNASGQRLPAKSGNLGENDLMVLISDWLKCVTIKFSE